MELRTVLFGLGILTTVGVLDAPAQARQPREPRNNLEWIAVGQALETGGLPAAAAVFGKYSGEEPFGGPTKFDLVGLAWASHAIVTGEVVEVGRSLLTEDKQHIVTEVTLAVQRVFKGEPVVQRGSHVAVTSPGGQVTFGDGSTAATSVAGGFPFKPGRSYLLFLELIDDPDAAASSGRLNTFRPAGGAQGVQELVPNQKVLPTARTGPVAEELRAVQSWEEAFQIVAIATAEAATLENTKHLRQR